MPDDLTREELVSLVRTVFAPRPEDRALAVLVDLPDPAAPDRPAWADRRGLAAGWAARLAEAREELGLERVDLVLYRNVRQPNADLPERAWTWDPAAPLPADADAVPAGTPEVAMEDVLAGHELLIACTEMSATAPLKLAARRLGFRAATMPGFSREMIPALRLDWEEIDRRCRVLAGVLDEAEAAHFLFEAAGDLHELTLDLRFRRATASGGLVREPGRAGNVPSGETYIVPYEGEREGEPSRSAGTIPVDLDGEVVLYEIRENRAVAVHGEGPAAAREREFLAAEPAYGNLAELGLGVLGEFGIRPIGELLLDEKLGPHIAFGRSDHFGGIVGAKDFSRPENVVHIDRVFLPEMQPGVLLRSLVLTFPGGGSRVLFRDGRWAPDAF